MLFREPSTCPSSFIMQRREKCCIILTLVTPWPFFCVHVCVCTCHGNSLKSVAFPSDRDAKNVTSLTGNTHGWNRWLVTDQNIVSRSVLKLTVWCDCWSDRWSEQPVFIYRTVYLLQLTLTAEVQVSPPTCSGTLKEQNKDFSQVRNWASVTDCWERLTTTVCVCNVILHSYVAFKLIKQWLIPEAHTLL